MNTVKLIEIDVHKKKSPFFYGAGSFAYGIYRYLSTKEYDCLAAVLHNDPKTFCPI
ncbi:MAG: hypothetical protein HKO68_05180 [Desulfobacterales bacterium]|nr:hypothetical protein [Desulfobacterales bacterium]